MPPKRAHPLDFDEVAARVGVTSRVPAGVRPIRVTRIVGSAGKAQKIGPDFLPLGAPPASGNFQSIERRLQAGETLPPITVYQIGQRFFVIDGHTRVAAALKLGLDFIDAEVIECLPRREGTANLTYYARREFERSTGLEGIRLTAPWRYELLQHHLDGYRLYLALSRNSDVSLPEAARIWYRSQYLPTLLEIRRRNLTSRWGGRTAGDVYTDILRRWAEEREASISLREMMDRYDEEMRPLQPRLASARRRVSQVVDAALPKAIPPVGATNADQLTAHDIEAEMQALGEIASTNEGPESPSDT